MRLLASLVTASLFALALPGGAALGAEPAPEAPLALRLLAAGREAVGRGELGEADQALRGALAACRAEGEERCRWEALSTLTTVALIRGRTDEARGFAYEAASEAHRMRDRLAQGESYHLLAMVLAAAGQADEADEAAQRALAVAWELGRSDLAARARAVLGELALAAGHTQEACRTFEKALGGAEDAGLVSLQVRARLGLGRCLMEGGDYGKAGEVLERAFPEAVRLGDKLLVARLMHEMGRLEALRGEAREAEELLVEAAGKFDSLGAVVYAERTASYLGRLRAEASLPTDEERAERAAEATRRGIQRIEAGEVEAAVEEFKRAASLAPEDPEPHLELARAYRSLGLIEQAAQEEETASALSNSNSPFDLTSTNPRYQAYFGRARRQIDRVYVVPEEVARVGVAGEVRVSFTLERSGRLAGAKIESSSGPALLEEAALTTLRLAEPFGPFPKGVSQDRVTITARFIYDQSLAGSPPGPEAEATPPAGPTTEPPPKR